MYDEILSVLIDRERNFIVLPSLDQTGDEAVEFVCYQALAQIKAILEDGDLDDPECFRRIEAIVHVFEEIGSGCGNRHDFG